jgi:hypothetical protein
LRFDPLVSDELFCGAERWIHPIVPFLGISDDFFTAFGVGKASDFKRSLMFRMICVEFSSRKVIRIDVFVSISDEPPKISALKSHPNRGFCFCFGCLALNYGAEKSSDFMPLSVSDESPSPQSLN